MTALRVGTTREGNLNLPDNAVSQGFGILARRRSGKSNLAGVMEETFCQRGDPWVCLDPVSAHWGIRYLDDNGQPGKPSGYDVMIVGGKYGDVPFDEHSGGSLAQIIVDTDISCVIDLGNESMNAMHRFVADFANELRRINETPRHVLIEEAHTFIPQQLIYDNQKVVRGAVTKLGTMGGGKGIGYSIISQRPASVAKDMLEQIDNLFVLRMSGPRDLKAVEDWFEHNVGDKAAMKEVLTSLPGFAPGEAWICAPDWIGVERAKIRERKTYHAGRTPKRGEKVVAPRRVELGKVIEQFRAAATKRQIAVREEVDLKKELAETKRELAAAKKPVMLQAKPCDHLDDMATMSRLIDSQRELLTRAGIEIADQIETMAGVSKFIDDLVNGLKGVTPHRLRVLSQTITAATVRAPARAENGRASTSAAADFKNLRVDSPVAKAGEQIMRSMNGHEPLSGPQQKIVNAMGALDEFGIKMMPIPTVAAHARRSSAGRFQTTLSELVTAGMIERPQKGFVTLMDAGRAIAVYETMASAEDLRERWLGICSGPQRGILAVLIDEYPNEVSVQEIADRLGRSSAGRFQTTISEVCTKGAATRPRKGFVRAADILFP